MVAAVSSILYLIKYYGGSSLGGGGRVLSASSGVAAAGPSLATGGLAMRAFEPRKPAAGTPEALIATAAASGDRVGLWLAGLPSLAKLDILTYRIVSVGLPLLTIGIITGAWWAKEAWGAYWQWDPKETAALFSWTVYALYMHLHTRNTWRGLRSAWLSVVGFLSILFCYLGVNIWISGLHSYKM
jgi:cytochrome c-type biogenesis protein CcsB